MRCSLLKVKGVSKKYIASFFRLKNKLSEKRCLKQVSFSAVFSMLFASTPFIPRLNPP